MVPSHQRFEPDDLVRRHRHDGLIHQAEFAPLDGVLQVTFQLQFGLMRLQDRGVEDFTVRAAEHACPVQRRLRVTQDVLGLAVSGGAHSHADARRQEQFTAVDREGCEDFLEKAIGNDRCVADGFEAVEQHGELVGLDARYEVVAAQGGVRIRDPKARFQAARGRGEKRS